MRVDDFANLWLETYKKPVLTAKSYGNVKRQVDKVIIPRIGSLRLVNVTDIHLQSILNTRAGKSYSHVKKLRDIPKGDFQKGAGIPADCVRPCRIFGAAQMHKRYASQHHRTGARTLFEGRC